MAKSVILDHLQPCLLDRLTDDRVESAKESRDSRVISMTRLRAAFVRDMAWLLNSNCHPPDSTVHEYDEVARSVLNYGIPDVCGVHADHHTPENLERLIYDALLRFEPRIVPGTLRITAAADREHLASTALVFEISCQMWAQPMPDPLYLRTEVDLETGHCEIEKA